MTSPMQDREETLAKRNQRAVLGIAEGFFDSCVLFALLKLRIFDLVGTGSKTITEISAKVGASSETLARLLNAGVALKLLESQDGENYRLAPVASSVLLSSAGGGYLGDWIQNLQFFCEALLKLDQAVLRSEPVVDPSAHLGEDRAMTRKFTLAMHDYAALRGKELAKFLDTAQCQSLLDLGCGPGTYAFHLGKRNPELELFLADFPGVLEVAREVETRYALQNKVHYLPMDALRDEIPGSYDLILVSNTLHMLGEEASRKLIRRLYQSVNRGGSLVIQAQYFNDDRLGERWPIMLDLIQLCITSKGRNHTVGETERWLKEAGFSMVQYFPMSMLNTNSFLRGYKR